MIICCEIVCIYIDYGFCTSCRRVERFVLVRRQVHRALPRRTPFFCCCTTYRGRERRSAADACHCAVSIYMPLNALFNR